MNRKKGLALLTALACTLITGVTSPGAYASDSVVAGAHHPVPNSHNTPARQNAALPQRTKCRRNGVVWSSGVASRFADRISPRPVRSRWDHKTDSGVGCAEVDAFKRYRVSEQPWIR